jgi:hypothetical protein
MVVGLYGNAVEKGNPCIVTAAGAFEVVVKDPLLSILE